MRPDVRTKAESAMSDMRAARDAFRKSIEQHEQVNEAAPGRSKAALESQWAAFEDSVQTYLESVGKQVTEQEMIFRARADAQSKAWQQAIGNLHKSATSFAADRRGEKEAAVKRLESEADAAKVKLDKLNKAESASWVAMKSALTETRAALDRAHQAGAPHNRTLRLKIKDFVPRSAASSRRNQPRAPLRCTRISPRLDLAGGRQSRRRANCAGDTQKVGRSEGTSGF